ncbi:MAG TPA: HAD family phosphatase [Rhizobiales bacterium]|nr:HAD family phosphatase [Hyphomicrobiales bacterium]
MEKTSGDKQQTGEADLGRIEAVVFDIGNVLISWDPCNLYRKMGFADSRTRQILEETALLEVNHRQLDAGAPYRESLEELASQYPQHRDFILAFDTRWTEMLDGAIAPSVAALAKLKAEGVPVYGLSNFSLEKFELARRIFPFLESFDELVISGAIKMVKPDREIFDYLIARCRLDPARSLFIDDNQENISAARELGFDAILFVQGKTDLAHELAHRMVVRQ